MLQQMIKRISAFQRRLHPAWNEGLEFSQRIADLPLYALEFNNCDRRESDGPTIAHYAPSRSEIATISRLCSQLGLSQPTLLDVGCGNGFIGSLIAREGLRTVGIDDWSWPRPQIQAFYDPKCYELRAPCELSLFADHFDVAICSWMLPNANLTGEIVRLKPALLIHVWSPDRSADGNPTTGCTGAYKLPVGYRHLAAWAATTPPDYFHALDPRLTGNGTQIRLVEIWRREDVPTLSFAGLVSVDDEYPWQQDRAMLNAVRKSRGLPATELSIIPI
jgi:hypothetical protein